MRHPTTIGLWTAITLSACGGGGGGTSTLPLQGSGVLVTSSATLDFASQPLGTQSTSKSITVSNNGSGALTISGITVGGGQSGAFIANHLCSNVSVGGHCVINVGFKPLDAGPHIASLSINSDVGTQTVNLTGVGLAQQVTVIPSAISFGNVWVNGNSAAHVVTIVNTGSAPLQLDSVTIAGNSDASAFGYVNSCGTAVAVGASCRLSLSFKPTTAGTQSATLAIRSNAPRTSTVTLNGMGAAPGVSYREPDGISELPRAISDITKMFSLAGTWQPVANQFLNADYTGTIANVIATPFSLDPSGRESVVLSGWANNGGRNAQLVPVNLAIVKQQADGSMRESTLELVADPRSNGTQGIVVADFNADGYPDVFLGPYNEDPLVAAPSTVLMSNGSGGLIKQTVADNLCAHDSALTTYKGTPTIITSTTCGKGDSAPFYSYSGGSLKLKTFPLLSRFWGLGMSIALDEFRGPGQYAFALGNAYSFPLDIPEVRPAPASKVAFYPFDGTDVGIQPLQVMDAYFKARPQFAGITSLFGLGVTHTYRIRNEDFNHDGVPDAIGFASLFPQPYAALQMLQNQGSGTFKDVSDELNAHLGLFTNEWDYGTQIRDVDGSGINSYLGGTEHFYKITNNATNLIVVNDGTGHLYPALADWYDTARAALNPYVATNMKSHQCNTWVMRFTPYKTASGKFNLLANIRCTAPPSTTEVHVFVNIATQIDLKSMYTRPITIQNRNGSKKIRTFAGDDVIYAGNNGGYCTVDGGLGKNTVVYSGPAGNYQVTRNSNGSWRVADQVGKDGTDDLGNIQWIVFTDQTRTLN